MSPTSSVFPDPSSMCSPDVVLTIHEESASDPPLVPGFGGEAWSATRMLLYRRVVDLTHTLSPDFPVFPFYRPVQIRRLAKVETDGWGAAELTFPEHTGTHLDAPAHFVAGGLTADCIPAERLLAPLVVVSIAEKAERDDDALLTVDDLHAWERRHGTIPRGAVVALHSAWEARLAEPGRFLNADATGTMHSPGFSADAAGFLVEDRAIVGAATDTLSLDIGASTDYAAHRVFLPAGRFGLENVANLALVPPVGATLIVGGPKHLGATGGPARLLALV